MARRNPPAKWVLPDVINPPDSICFTVRVPNNVYHIGAFRGALYNLTSARFWQDDPAHTALLVAKVWQDIYDQITAVPCETPLVPSAGNLQEDYLLMLAEPYCDAQGKCRFHIRCDVCDPWIDVALVSDLIANPPGTGNQPAPGGGTSSFCGNVAAIDGRVFPVQVNSGDLITVSSATGHWNDGSLVEHCVNGDIFFIACTGSGAAPVGGADVVPLAPHMSAVVRFSSGYFAIYPGGSLVVPMGIVNEEPFIVANKPTLNSGSGSIDMCITVQNNQAATWSHFFDFTLSPQGFMTNYSTGNGGVWVPGQGFKVTDVQDGIGTWFRNLAAKRIGIANFEITSAVMNFDYILGNFQTCPGNTAEAMVSTDGVTPRVFVNNDCAVVVTGANQLKGGPGDFTGQNEIIMALVTDENAASPAGFVGAATLKNLLITGKGSQPVW